MSSAGRTDIWMPFYTADYARDTLHLTRDQHGGYLLLLIACWNGGGRLLNKPGHLAAIAKATPDEWRTLAPVLKAFFRVDGKWLVHKRVVEELERAARISAARKASGLLGGRPRKQTESKPKANGYANGNQNHKQNETHARVTVDVLSTSETGSSSEIPSQIEDSESKVGKSADIVRLARPANR